MHLKIKSIQYLNFFTIRKQFQRIPYELSEERCKTPTAFPSCGGLAFLPLRTGSWHSHWRHSVRICCLPQSPLSIGWALRSVLVCGLHTRTQCSWRREGHLTWTRRDCSVRPRWILLWCLSLKPKLGKGA